MNAHQEWLQWLAHRYPDVIVELPPGQYHFDEPTTITFEGRDLIAVGDVRLQSTRGPD
jgi:hypothetical protein